MRISTSQIFSSGINKILNTQSQVSKQQQHLASGKRVEVASDDPIGASRIINLRQQIASVERYQENTAAAQNHLQLQDTILDSASNILQRVRELQIQANNDALGDEGRANIKVELEERLQELYSVMNTQDANGKYLFSGFQTTTQPFIQDASGNYVYQGDNGVRYMEISPGHNMPVSDPGYSLFANVRQGNGSFHISDPGATNTGTAVVGASSLTDPTSYTGDTYTLSFVTNSSGDLAYQVVGATTGQVIPALPALIPDDAPAYVDGANISFDGINFSITGEPQVGDNFEIAPSSGQNILTTMQQMISNLEIDTATPQKRAQQQNEFNQTLYEIDQALDSVITKRTELGTRMNSLESTEDSHADFIVFTKQTLSRIEDLDLAEAITEMETKLLSLQAAQQVFSRVSNLSLLNFI